MKRMILNLSIAFSIAVLFTASASTTALAYGGPPAAEAAKAELRGDADLATVGWERIGAGALLIDVRSSDEFSNGHIEGALNIPHSDIDALKAAIGPDTQRSVVLYCGSGRRADRALDKLESLGYSNIYNASGLDALQATQP